MREPGRCYAFFQWEGRAGWKNKQQREMQEVVEKA